MSTYNLNYHNFRIWVKQKEHPIAKLIYTSVRALHQFELPCNKTLYGVMYQMYKNSRQLMSDVLRIVLWTPMFKSRVVNTPKRLYLYTGLPYITGSLKITVGNDCRISGQSTFSGRSASRTQPELVVGNNVDIGWQTTIAVGSRVIIGNNVRIAGRAFLAGYPGHPLNAEDRAAGLPCLDEQVGNIILEDDVWLATGVSVMAGVTVGRGTIVAAGSVVTHDLPAYCLAGGVPARVIRTLNQ